MTEKERELTPEEKAAEVERLADIERRLEEQPNGSLKVTLREPVSLEGGAERSTLLVRATTARAIRDGRKAIQNGEEPDFAFAAVLVEPKDAHLEIRRNDDLALVGKAVDRSLGKFLRDGSEPSAS